MADRGRDRGTVRNVGDPSAPDAVAPESPHTSGHSQPVDAGKTSGGGSSGHDQPDDVAGQAPIRNQGTARDASLRDRQPPDPLPESEP